MSIEIRLCHLPLNPLLHSVDTTHGYPCLNGFNKHGLHHFWWYFFYTRLINYINVAKLFRKKKCVIGGLLKNKHNIGTLSVQNYNKYYKHFLRKNAVKRKRVFFYNFIYKITFFTHILYQIFKLIFFNFNGNTNTHTHTYTYEYSFAWLRSNKSISNSTTYINLHIRPHL